MKMILIYTGVFIAFQKRSPSTRMRRENVGSHAIIFKSLSFGPFTLKCNPGVFKLKWGLQRFRSLRFQRVKNARVV